MMLGSVWMVIFWGAVLAIVMWGLSKLNKSEAPPTETPLDIAKRRYAKGEIDKQQLEEIKQNVA
jgi:putative membrane protein